MKKNENLDSKLQILTPNQEIFKNSKKFSFFFIFSVFFSFSLPVAPEIQESHEKQWKTIKNKGKWKNMIKKWKFGLKVADSHSEPGNLQKLEEIFFFFIFFIFFFIFLILIFFSFSLPVAPEIQESHEKQWKTIKNKGNEKKWSCKWKNEVWWQKVMNKNEKTWR